VKTGAVKVILTSGYKQISVYTCLIYCPVVWNLV